MNHEIRTFSETPAFWEQALSIFSAADPGQKAPFRIAASGGSSAQIFDHVLARNISPEHWRVFQTDERYVPHDHDESNTLLLNTKFDQKEVGFTPFRTDIDPESAARNYAQILEKIKDDQGYLFDLSILGIGPDGHTASLFPGNSALKETSALTAVTHTDQFAVPTRLTLTYPALQKSRHILVLLIGASKTPLIEKLKKDTVKALPASTVLQWPQTQSLFLQK